MKKVITTLSLALLTSLLVLGDNDPPIKGRKPVAYTEASHNLKCYFYKDLCLKSGEATPPKAGKCEPVKYESCCNSKIKKNYEYVSNLHCNIETCEETWVIDKIDLPYGEACQMAFNLSLRDRLLAINRDF